MLMKSSSGINIGNGNNCTENRKITTASFSSPSSSSACINKCVTKTNTVLLKSSTKEKDDIQQQEQQLNDFIHPTGSFYTSSISSFKSESIASNFKFEITPQTINQINQYQTNIQRRPRIQWIKRHASSHSKTQNPTTNSSAIITRSTLDINTTPRATNLVPAGVPDAEISITEMSVKEFEDEYKPYIEQVYQPNTNQNGLNNSFKSVSTNVPVTDVNITDHERDRTFVSQNSQTSCHDPRAKKTIKSATYPKKVKSATKRPNLPSATQLSQNTAQAAASSVLSSPNRAISQNELTTATIPKTVSSTIAKIEDSSTKNLITIDTSKARSNLEVVRSCLRELGWKECFNGTNPDSDIYWHSSSFHEGNANIVFNSGRVNKFPGMNELLRKVHLTRLLNNMRLLFPNEFEFYPKTWFLPEQTQQFKDDVRYIHQQDKKHNRSLTTFIVKPSDGSQGEGIYLLRDPAHCIVTNRPHVVQEYIDRPLLINGLKFDLRIYVLILNLYPLEIFLYDEGLVRFATIGYKAPSTENLHQTFMHLTNYSLNKRSSSYKHATDNTQSDGSKRKLTSVWSQLKGIYGDERIERTKILITEMINKTILAILPELRVEYEFELPLGKKQNISCFQIVGFDIILTDHLKPVLLEVNANPSLRIDFDKENESGKLVYQPSPIDEEIKKPLVMETLKLALPKKKLSTFTRHAQLQVNDELIAQRVEKVAQRRVEERTEKIRSARKTRFDLKSNPFFSRPYDTVARDFERLQQEQQEQVQPQKVLIPCPSNPIESSPSSHYQSVFASNTQSSFNTNGKSKSISPRQTLRTKKAFDSTDDEDDESGITEARLVETNQNIRGGLYQNSSATVKRTSTKSATNRSIATVDSAAYTPIKKLKIIFPSIYKTKYRHLFLLDKIAYIYIQHVIMLGHKTMTSGQFRSFASICGILNETITAPTIDILYYQILRKWQQFVLRTSSTGLPFTAFIEAFFLLSQRKFPSSQSLIDSVNQLVSMCVRNLNTCLQSPSSSLIQQSNQYLLHRASRINSSVNPSSMNNRSTVVALRSTTTATNRPNTTATNRSSATAPFTSPTVKPNQTTPSATAVTKTTTDEKLKPSAKSVFPLFFNVL